MCFYLSSNDVWLAVCTRLLDIVQAEAFIIYVIWRLNRISMEM